MPELKSKAILFTSARKVGEAKGRRSTTKRHHLAGKGPEGNKELQL